MKKYLIISIILGISNYVFADSWRMPTIESYYSENGMFMLKVFPTKYPDKYWDWMSAKPNKKNKFSAQDTTIDLCHATLFRIENNDTIKIWNKKLINEMAPVNVIVANDGSSITTFDNWGSMGYGLNVMAVYDSKGGLLTRYKLEEFSPIPINEFMMTISSIWWRCDAKYIDCNTIEICFKAENDSMKKLRYFVDENRFINEPFPPPRLKGHEKYWPDSLSSDEINELEKALNIKE
jgi:hypothetical protein